MQDTKGNKKEIRYKCSYHLYPIKETYQSFKLYVHYIIFNKFLLMYCSTNYAGGFSTKEPITHRLFTLD